MPNLLSSTSRVALLAVGCVALTPLAAFADTFTVPSATGPQTLSGTQTGTIGAGYTLDGGSSNAIKWNGNATGAGVVITNSGTVTSTGRAIDSSSGVTGTFTVYNRVGGTIKSTNDAIRVDSAATGGSIIIDNAGTIRSQTGQAIDLAGVTAGSTLITNYSTGLIESTEHDAVRPGQAGRVRNYGTIRGGITNGEPTVANSSSDGIQFDDGLGGTVDNYTGGVIVGARHGVTADWYVNVTNEVGATITGLNGSGVGSDGHGEVWNYGTITGQIDSVSTNGDGDGVDIDYNGKIVNYGTIQGLGAKGQKDGQENKAEGIAMGGGSVSNASETAVIFGKHNGILVDDGNDGSAYYATTITNVGSITGELGYGIKLVGDYGDVIYNYGSIVGGGGTAVDLGAGNDVFVHYDGSSVTGTVLGGDGFDQFALAGNGTFDIGQFGESATYRGFEELYVNGVSTLTGTSDFAGTTRVSYAALILDDASLANSVVTLEGPPSYGTILATLAGNGTVGGFTNNGRALISPGMAGEVGTLYVNGDAHFGALSEYEVTTTSGGKSDLIAVTGETVIDDETIVHVKQVGTDFSFGTRYTILTSAGGIDGEFGKVDSELAFLTPTLSYDDTTVYLMLNRNDVSFASVGVTRNQSAVGAAVEAAGAGWEVYDEVIVSTTEEARRGFDLLSGEAHASLGNVLFNQSSLVADTLIGRLRQAPVGSSAQTAALGYGGPATAYAARVSEPSAFKAVKAPAPAPVGPVYATWAQGFGQWTKADGNGNAGEVDASVGGFLAGADVTTANNLTFGIAGGYASASSDVDDRLSSVDASTVMIAAYAGASLDAFRLRAGASYGWSDIDTRRTAIVGNVVENPNASYDGSTANVFAEAAYVFEVAGTAFEPFAQVAWSRVDTDAFTETNAPITGLASNGLSFDTAYTTLGARVAGSFAAGGGTVVPHASLGWRHAFGDATPELAMAFVDTGTGFTVAGAPIAENSLVVGAGIDYNFNANFVLGVAYEGQFASDTEYNAVKGSLTYRF